MDKITRTAYGSVLQTCLLFGIPYKWLPFTTLNELLGVQEGQYPSAEIFPRAQYYCIGNKGHSFAPVNGLTELNSYQHKATDAAPFGITPFVMREPTNDLSPVERARYALRREETHNGVRFIAYYLKRLVMGTVTADLLYKTIKDDGSVTVTPFVPDSSNLHPVPQSLEPVGVNVTAGDYVVAQALIPLSMTRADTDELKNVANILYGSTNLAMFSELGLVTGVDKRIDASASGNTTFTFMECIGAQIVSHMSLFFHANTSNDGTTLVLNAGATEPLFNIEAGVINEFSRSTGVQALSIV